MAVVSALKLLSYRVVALYIVCFCELVRASEKKKERERKKKERERERERERDFATYDSD